MKEAAERLFAKAPRADQLPWSVVDGVQQLVERLKPPVWLESEIHNRLILLVNHVLQAEPEAMQRLSRHAKKSIQLQLKPIALQVRITPVGLLELEACDGKPDLSLELKSDRWSEAAKSVSAGAQPDVHLYGDVLLAAEIGWLRENLRWDIEEDIARLFGDGPATLFVGGMRRLLDALRGFASPTRSVVS